MRTNFLDLSDLLLLFLFQTPAIVGVFHFGLVFCNLDSCVGEYD